MYAQIYSEEKAPGYPHPQGCQFQGSVQFE